MSRGPRLADKVPNYEPDKNTIWNVFNSNFKYISLLNIPKLSRIILDFKNGVFDYLQNTYSKNLQ